MKTHLLTFIVLAFLVFGFHFSSLAQQKIDTTQIRYVKFESTLSAEYTRLALAEIKASYDGVNVAQNKSITANSNRYDYNVSKVVDGNETSGWFSDDYLSLTTESGYGPTAYYPHYIVVDLGIGFNLDSLKLDINAAGRWSFDYTFDFLVSADSTNWSLVDRKDNSHGVYAYTNIPIQNVRYIKYTCFYSSDLGQVNVEEIQAYSNGVNVALSKKTYVNSGWIGDAAVDGNSVTRWSSYRYDHFTGPRAATAPVIVTVDLGGVQTVDSLQLIYGSATIFKISVSADGTEWLQIDQRLNDKNKYTYLLNRSIRISSDITAFTSTTATCEANITYNGGPDITARGVCWSTSPNPTILNNKTTNGTGMGSFVATLNGLVDNTLYYVRAYATNASETKYSNVKCFITGFSVQTDVIKNLTYSTATSGGFIKPINEFEIIERGVCWGISSLPSIANDHTSNGTGTREFTSNLSGLKGGTKYYVRAYATTNFGTYYGNEYSFKYQNTQYQANNDGWFGGEIYTETGTLNNQMYFSGSYGGDLYFDGSVWILGGYITTEEVGNPPLNGWWEGTGLSLITAIQNPAVAYNKTSLRESSYNDGSFIETLTITHDNANGATFTGVNNEDFVETGKAMVWNLPAGLTARVVRNNGLSLTLSLTGYASAHAIPNDVSNVKVMLLPQAFTDGSTLLTTGNSAQLSINYNEQVQLTTGTKTCSDSSIAPLAYIRNSNIIISNLAQPSTIRLYDVTGRMLFNKNVSETGTYEITLKLTGMYIIQIDTNSGNWKFKLLNN